MSNTITSSSIEAIKVLWAKFTGSVKKNKKPWLIALAVLLTIGVVAFAVHRVRASRLADQLAEREALLAEIALLQGQVELAEGLWFSRAREVDSLERTLRVLDGENSELLRQINLAIEQPVVTYQTQIVYRDRVVYVRDESEPSRNTSEGQVSVETNPDTQSTIVSFDLYRRPYRLVGQTDSSGPSVEISVEQVDPFILDAVLTRQHANQAWNLFLSDPNKELDVAVRNFYVQDIPPPRPTFRERIRYGAMTNASASTISVSGLLGVEFDRAVVYGGPSWTSVLGDAQHNSIGGSLGFLLR